MKASFARKFVLLSAAAIVIYCGWLLRTRANTTETYPAILDLSSPAARKEAAERLRWKTPADLRPINQSISLKGQSAVIVPPSKTSTIVIDFDGVAVEQVELIGQPSDRDTAYRDAHQLCEKFHLDETHLDRWHEKTGPAALEPLVTWWEIDKGENLTLELHRSFNDNKPYVLSVGLSWDPADANQAAKK